MIDSATIRYPVHLAVPFSLHPGFDDQGDVNRPQNSAAAPGERLLGKRILIVEDQALLALELQFAFEDEGAEVIGPALSLPAARQTVIEGTEIDLAVLDVDLAGADVYPVAAMLQQRGVPFVFHTGHGTEAEIHAHFPAATICIKPTLPATLIAQLLLLG
jgi:DNA-binding response OmpR family regulator